MSGEAPLAGAVNAGEMIGCGVGVHISIPSISSSIRYLMIPFCSSRGSESMFGFASGISLKTQSRNRLEGAEVLRFGLAISEVQSGNLCMRRELNPLTVD